MLQFISLSSGSSGNCYIFTEDHHSLMIDHGIGMRKFKKIVSEYKINTDEIEALLLTHEHFDHSRSVGEFSLLKGIPVYAHGSVHDAIQQNPRLYKKIPLPQRRDVICGEKFIVGCFQITAFNVPHDSVFNLGYFITTPSTNICLITDIGSFQPQMLSYIRQSRNLVIEANYDPEMLLHGKYPAMLKRRIASENGHTSNQQTATILSQNVTHNLQHIFLCHLSANNNTPRLAQHTIEEKLRQTGCNIPITPLARTSPTGIFQLGGTDTSQKYPLAGI